MLVTDDDDRALLGRQARWPAGRFSTLAGFVDPGESLEQAVAREVMEEVGVEVADVTYFGNQPWPFPSSLMVGFFARRRTTDDRRRRRRDRGDARWFTREEMRAEAEAGDAGAARAASRSAGRWSRRGTAARSPATGDRSTLCRPARR